MTAVIEPLQAPGDASASPDGVELLADTDTITKGCACSASDDHPF